ncbi:MAG: WhiB family transcriptional regulator [Actinomycetia bacterium]|nr:WhiB family transcriptional regulator [Actinomycetes bacterium]
MTLDLHTDGIHADRQDPERPADPRPAWERIAYAWLEREVDHGQALDAATLAREVSVAPGLAHDLVRVLRAERDRDPGLSELRARLVRDRITDAYLARELPGGQQLDPKDIAEEVGTTTTVARQWLQTLRASQQSDRRLAGLRGEPASHGRPAPEQLQALQAAYAGGGRPQPDQAPAVGQALEHIEQLYQTREVAGSRPLDPAEVARQVGVSAHYVRGTLTALRGGTLTNAQRIEQLWRLWEAEGGQRLEFSDVARLVGVREGRVRQVLGPLRTAHRHATEAERAAGPVAVIEDDGRQAWLDQAACRDLDPERFFPEPGEQVKAAEAKAICAGCQVRDHCRDLAVKAAGGFDADHGVFGGTLPEERSPLRGNRFPEPSVYRQRRDLAEAAHQLAGEVGLRQAAKQLHVHRDVLKAAFTQWELPMPERRVGSQPSRFLADRAEAERAFRLAEQLGSVNAAAAELDTTWPSLRKAFTRHGLGMPARNPEAIRQRAIATAISRHAGQPAAPPPDPVFVALNPGQLPTRRGGQAEQGVRLRRAEEIETLSYRTVVELNAESRLAPERRVATITRRPERAQRLASNRTSRATRRHVDREQRGDRRADRTDRTSRPHQPEERGMVADAR